MKKSTHGWHKMAKEDTALGALQRSTAKDQGQRHKASLAEGNFGIERSYRKRLAKDMKHTAKAVALKKRAGTPTPHTAKDCGHKCVYHNKGVKHID